MIRRLLKLGISLAVRGLDIVGGRLSSTLGRAGPARCVVLYYHGVPAELRERFGRQMDELLRLTRPVPATPPVSLSPGARHVSVTFDDGFVSVVENALPALRQRRIPCTVFVPSGCLGQRPAWIRNAVNGMERERVVSAEQLHALAKEPLVSVGSHSISHPNLLKLSPEQAALEFSRSKAHLEQVIGEEVGLFSFPFGAHNPALDQKAREVGYRRVFTSDPTWAFQGDDEFVTGRVSVNPDDWRLEFRLKIAGAYRWSSHLQAARRQLRTWFWK